jgi:DNA-binding LacI/PurR family transcriptional regulator
MGISGDRPWSDWVSYDDTEAGRLAAGHLIEKGHRHCAYIGLPQGVRGQVFTEAIRAAGGTVACFDVESLMTRREDIHEVDAGGMDAIAGRIAAMDPRPSAIFTWSDMLTAVLYPSLYAQGLIPGRDITVVSCNNEYPLIMGLRPRPTVVDIQGMKVGQRAIEQLLWRIANRDESRVVTFLTPVLVPSHQ